jgi:hypothetical protein
MKGRLKMIKILKKFFDKRKHNNVIRMTLPIKSKNSEWTLFLK